MERKKIGEVSQGSHGSSNNTWTVHSIRLENLLRSDGHAHEAQEKAGCCSIGKVSSNLLLFDIEIKHLIVT